jgi:hypothetical protein
MSSFRQFRDRFKMAAPTGRSIEMRVSLSSYRLGRSVADIPLEIPHIRAALDQLEADIAAPQSTSGSAIARRYAFQKR